MANNGGGGALWASGGAHFAVSQAPAPPPKASRAVLAQVHDVASLPPLELKAARAGPPAEAATSLARAAGAQRSLSEAAVEAVRVVFHTRAIFACRGDVLPVPVPKGPAPQAGGGGGTSELLFFQVITLEGPKDGVAGASR